MESKNSSAASKCSGMTPLKNAERHRDQQLAACFDAAMNPRKRHAFILRLSVHPAGHAG
jgi:hypothetical protein